MLKDLNYITMTCNYCGEDTHIEIKDIFYDNDSFVINVEKGHLLGWDIKDIRALSECPTCLKLRNK
jgi:hypothetical protein